MDSDNERNGNWIDRWGACKVCGGEIPHGHTENCDIYKLECSVRVASLLLHQVLHQRTGGVGLKVEDILIEQNEPLLLSCLKTLRANGIII
jgi:hypothetical protein